MTTKKLIEKVQQIVAIPSTADNSKAVKTAMEVVAKMLASCPGVTVQRFERGGKPSLLAYIGSTRPESFAVLLNGHIDVVSGTPEQFRPTIISNRLYGRGALDMKAATLALTAVFCELAPQLNYPLGIQVTSDEELGGHNGTDYHLEQGVRANFVICGESTTLGTISHKSRGVYQARLQFKGRAAHSARLWDGDNAALSAIECVNRLLHDYTLPKKPFFGTTVNVSGINTTSNSANQVADCATTILDIRYEHDDPNFSSKQKAIESLKSYAPSAEIEVLLYEPAYFADPGHPMAKKLARALSEITGTKTSFVQQPGAADTRLYSALGIPAFILGVQGENMHGKGENVELDSIERYYQTLKLFLKAV